MTCDCPYKETPSSEPVFIRCIGEKENGTFCQKEIPFTCELRCLEHINQSKNTYDYVFNQHSPSWWKMFISGSRTCCKSDTPSWNWWEEIRWLKKQWYHNTTLAWPALSYDRDGTRKESKRILNEHYRSMFYYFETAKDTKKRNDKENTLFNLWYMDNYDYENIIQWLPKEVLEDIILIGNKYPGKVVKKIVVGPRLISDMEVALQLEPLLNGKSRIYFWAFEV